MSYNIDFVIPWVDGSDPKWKAEKDKHQKVKYSQIEENKYYRDWDLLKYWFRGVEKFSPWVNNIYFITWGHIPKWLNIEHPKLKIVNHKDYMPKEFLPTFCSHAIELNIHRIEGLSEQFVYFNDDIFLTDYVKKSDFFKNGIPCDSAIIQPIYPASREEGFYHILSSDIALINLNFKKRKVMKNNIFKWINLKYGKYGLLNIYFSLINKFEGFRNFHLASPFLKSTLEEVWEKEYDKLYTSSTHKFKNYEDVNQYIFKYWQFAKGKFYPSKYNIGKYFETAKDCNEICNSIKNQKYKMICINDTIEYIDFDFVKREIENAFEKILPEKSHFEI
ncbi:Stealth CR1 domain-containing protein [Intestinibacter sp.]